MLWKKNNQTEEIRSKLPDFYPRVWRFCLVLTGSRDLADDLAQATALRALEKAHLYKVGTKLDSWLFTLSKRIWLNELRSKAVRERGGIVRVDDIELVDSKSNTETNILASEVLLAMMNLPEAQSMTAFLVYVEGYKYTEAAEILDIPIGTVMSRLASVRQKLAIFDDEPGSNEK